MENNLRRQVVTGIGSGCAYSLTVSMIALVGSATVQVLNSFGYLVELEESSKRVMLMSICVSSGSILGGVVAGVLEHKGNDYLIDKVCEERQKVEKLERDNYFIREQMKFIRKEVEIEQAERKNRGDRLRQKQQRIEELESLVSQMKRQLPSGSQFLADWQDWEELVKELWGTEYCVSSCRGCKYLDASSYEDRYLICAIHPYGKKIVKIGKQKTHKR
ncbi:MAG TPA: hypothetical protein VIQ31_25465 [Phormidium sp.]